MSNNLNVKVPATSANMGPGFDCLGIALDIWNSVSILDHSDDTTKVVVVGNGEEELERGSGNLVFQAFSRVFTEIGRDVPNVTLNCENKIPLSRGLGSSSAAIVGGLVLGNEYAGKPFNKNELAIIAAEMEGHPDNVVPACLGGMQIVIYDEDELVTASVPISEDISAVLYVPDVPMPTEKSRNLLGEKIFRQDAVFNIGRSALLIQSLLTGELSNLKYATQDMLHQPDRQKIFFPLKNILRAAMESGALGAFLSGAGSTILAICTDREYTIGYEMADAAMKSGISGEILVTKPSFIGAHLG